MYCAKCGMKLMEHANFCSNCGTTINQPINPSSIKYQVCNIECKETSMYFFTGKSYWQASINGEIIHKGEEFTSDKQYNNKHRMVVEHLMSLGWEVVAHDAWGRVTSMRKIEA